MAKSSPDIWFSALRRDCCGMPVAVALALLVAVLCPQPAIAQVEDNSFSEAVVQPLPPASVNELNSALQRLARNSRDVDALVDAGNASIKVSDIDAAIGFFGRAEELSPGNSRVKLGLAAAYVRKQRPLDALQLFDEAERAGASAGTLAGERGLAYDLVGDNASAQFQYQQALGLRDDDETRRRLALSFAMAGNRVEFEKILYPLTVKEDFASYRTRAFGLAILGEEAEAIAITEAVMPRTLSARIAPYLRYMPRLTKAQQAAAANLGIFPRAAQIGRDTPQIAQYAGSADAGKNADARLAPQGEPLGRREDASSPRRRPDRGRSTVEPESQPVGAVPAAAKAPAAAMARPSVTRSSDPFARARDTRRARATTSPPAPIQKSSAEEAIPGQVADAAKAKPDLSIGSKIGSEGNPAQALSTASSSATNVNNVAQNPATVASINGTGFDLARVGQPDTKGAASTAVKPVPADEPATVADAFASFTLEPSSGPAVPPGGVDILSIDPPREVARKPEPKIPAEAKPAPPKASPNPRRYWVQIATGRDRAALKFDWRRISRKVPDILGDRSSYVAVWGQTNRLLAGPFASAREAQSAVSQLKAKDVDSFTFTSAAGEEVEPLK